MPAVAVIREGQTLFGIIGCKVFVGGFLGYFKIFKKINYGNRTILLESLRRK